MNAYARSFYSLGSSSQTSGSPVFRQLKINPNMSSSVCLHFLTPHLTSPEHWIMGSNRWRWAHDHQHRLAMAMVYKLHDIYDPRILESYHADHVLSTNDSLTELRWLLTLLESIYHRCYHDKHATSLSSQTHSVSPSVTVPTTFCSVCVQLLFKK